MFLKALKTPSSFIFYLLPPSPVSHSILAMLFAYFEPPANHRPSHFISTFKSTFWTPRLSSSYTEQCIHYTLYTVDFNISSLPTISEMVDSLSLSLCRYLRRRIQYTSHRIPYLIVSTNMYSTVCSCTLMYSTVQYGAEVKCALLSLLAARAAAGRAVHGADRGARTRLDRHLPRARQRHRSRAHSGGVGAGSPLLYSSLLFSPPPPHRQLFFLFLSSPVLSSRLSVLFCSVLISGCAALHCAELRCAAVHFSGGAVYSST